MNPKAFYARWTWWPVLCLVVIGLSSTSLDWWDILVAYRAGIPAGGGCLAFLLGLLALNSLVVTGLCILGLWRLRRPVLSISDARLEYVPLLGGRRRTIDGTRVAGIAWLGWRRIVLDTREGKEVLIRLDWLPRRQRRAARDAIDDWVAEHLRRGSSHEEV